MREGIRRWVGTWCWPVAGYATPVNDRGMSAFDTICEVYIFFAITYLSIYTLTGGV